MSYCFEQAQVYTTLCVCVCVCVWRGGIGEVGQGVGVEKGEWRGRDSGLN